MFWNFASTVVNTPFNSTFSKSIDSGFGNKVTNSIENSNTNNNSSITSILSTTNTTSSSSSTTKIVNDFYSNSSTEINIDNEGRDILIGFTENEPLVANNNFDPITGEVVIANLDQYESLMPAISNQEAPIHTFYINGINNTFADYQNTVPLINNLLAVTGINSQVQEETYNLSGKPKPINFDFAQSIIQAVTSGNDFEGRKFTNNVVEKIQNIDQGNSLEDKFLIIAHSQGNFFAEDIFNQLPENIQQRTRILAISPFTDFPEISSDSFDYLLRKDDFPNRLKKLPAIAIPEDKHNLPSWPGNYITSFFPGDRDSHKIENYLDINQYSQGSQEDLLAEESFEQAKIKIQELLNFDSDIYQEEQTINQGLENSDDPFFRLPTQYNNDAFTSISNLIFEGSDLIFGW